MDIQHNAFYYKRGAVIKLRGTPKDPRGMLVANNTFFERGEGAVVQTEKGLREENNEYDVSFPKPMRCDFNLDGRPDYFMATGRNWWRSTLGAPHWFFVRRSTERPTACPRLLGDPRVPGEQFVEGL